MSQEPNQVRKVSDQEMIRINKMNELKDNGIDPFGAEKFIPKNHSAELTQEYAEFSKEELSEKKVLK